MPRPYIPVQEQRIIAERAQGRCEYCQSLANYATQSFAIEHVIPISLGGETILNNLALACSGCNGHKYNKITAPDPVDGTLVPLYHPRLQQWHEHFSWNEDYTLVVGLTSTGRATVEVLQLNRQGVVNLRRLLIFIGQHPPKVEDR
jgi:hypothetical protein